MSAEPVDPLTEQLRAADALRLQQRWAEALSAYHAILQAQPRLAVVAHNMAVCHMALRQYSAAVEYATIAQRLHGDLWQSGLIAEGRRAGAGRWWRIPQRR